MQDYYMKQIQYCVPVPPTCLRKKRKWSPLIPQMLNQSCWRKNVIPLDLSVDSVTKMGVGTMAKWCNWIIQWQRFHFLLLHQRIWWYVRGQICPVFLLLWWMVTKCILRSKKFYQHTLSPTLILIDWNLIESH